MLNRLRKIVLFLMHPTPPQSKEISKDVSDNKFDNLLCLDRTYKTIRDIKRRQQLKRISFFVKNGHHLSQMKSIPKG